jgi:hypothetical protein
MMALQNFLYAYKEIWGAFGGLSRGRVFPHEKTCFFTQNAL